MVVAVEPALWAELLALALGREPDVEILGRAASEDEILGILASAPKAVILFDYEALGPNSGGIIARVRRAAPRARALVLARRSGEDTVTLVLRAGAAGLIAKQSAYTTLLSAIRAVAAGEVWANRKATAQVIEQLVAARRPVPDEEPDLTRREWEVVDAVGRGLRSNEIAVDLGISPKTVKTHLNNIFAKTKLKGRFALALWAQGHILPKT